MPRPKYQITADDFTHARDYLQSQLLQHTLELRDETHADASESLESVLSGGTKIAKAKRLNAWCEEHLTTATWNGLKTSVRKRRQRWVNESRTVTLSVRAHELLKKAAERKGLTMSEVIEKRFGR
ncbi:MAG TPA: hypothetical protein DDW52_24160 [Planctomycetaceae bacterium]|nr:hypothetical protein [Planctomycetaceae bacterium]